MRDCYYVFIPGGARKSSSIQLARRRLDYIAGRPSLFYSSYAMGGDNETPTANSVISSSFFVLQPLLTGASESAEEEAGWQQQHDK